MANIFSVEFRTETGKGPNRRLRQKHADGLPHNSGIVYGFEEPMNISMRSDHALRFISKHLKSRTQMIDLEISKDGAILKKKVILQDYQLRPERRELLHVDFREVSANTIITLDVPINPVGTSKAVKTGGVLQVIRRTVSLRGKAGQIPADIEIDVTELEFGDSIHADEIKLPPGIELLRSKNDNFAIITIAAALAEEEEVAAVADPSAVKTDQKADLEKDSAKDKDKDKDKPAKK